MYKATLECRGIVGADLDELAGWIEEEFTRHRPWHREVRCWRENDVLLITSVNDFDADGMATLDEFGDALLANHAGENGPVAIPSVTVT